MKMTNKLALGTAQFGYDYGINNKRGKIPKDEVFKILNTAKEKSILFLDTAASYGDSEEVIGDFMKNSGISLQIISKIPQCSACDVEKEVLSSLHKLNLEKIYGFLIHNFKAYEDDKEIWNQLERLKDQGIIEKIGFSLYFPEELDSLLNSDLGVDIIQIPYSIFDQRFKEILSKAKARNIEVYARSVFLQGLILKEINGLGEEFNNIKPKIVKLHELSKSLQVPLSALCLNFAMAEEHIDKVVVGVDSLDNLNLNIQSIKYLDKVKENIKLLNEMKEDDENIILPFNWGK
ncbi:aldo/keto reductase [Nanoarchaeota archaeon]